MKKYLTILLFFETMLGLLPGITFAGFTIAPAIIEQFVDLGQTYDFKIKVENTGETLERVYLLVSEIKEVKSSGDPIFKKDDDFVSAEWEMASWIDLPEESFDINPGQMIEIPYKVSIPIDASPGLHAAAVFVSTSPSDEGVKGSAVTLIGKRVASLINLRVAGEALNEIRISEFKTDKFIYIAPEVNFEARIENLGNILIRPAGFVVVVDMWGRETTTNFNEAGGAIISGGQRVFMHGPWIGDGLNLGRHKASLQISYGEKGDRRSISRSTVFWVLPSGVLTYVIGGLIGFVLIVVIFAKLFAGRSSRGTAKRTRLGSGSGITKLAVVAAAILIFSAVFLVVILALFA